MFADLSLKHHSPQKTLKPTAKQKRVSYVVQTPSLSIREAFRTFSLTRTGYHYRPDMLRDELAISTLQQAAEYYPRYGLSKLFRILRSKGHSWRHKREYRI